MNVRVDQTRRFFPVELIQSPRVTSKENKIRNVSPSLMKQPHKTPTRIGIDLAIGLPSNCAVKAAYGEGLQNSASIIFATQAEKTNSIDVKRAKRNKTDYLFSPEKYGVKIKMYRSSAPIA